MNKGVVNGLLFGGATLVVGLILYMIDKSLFLSPSLRFILSLILPITFMSRAGISKRNELGGFATFTEVLQPIYLTLVIGSVIFALFQYGIMSSDSELLTIQKDIAVENLENLANLANLDEEQIADIRDMDPESLKPTVQSFLMMVSKNFILGFIIAVLIALIIKRKNPQISEQG